ncbi:MAG TPA: CAP domain-containing protein [Rhizomicrobium sp.]|nr:CAP domain-containing protein [Rhizomicrobium sp.]
MNLRWTLAVALVLVCASCTGQRLVTAPARPVPVDPKTQMAALERRIFMLIQNDRHEINPAAKPLRLDAELFGIAEQRSRDMAAKSYIAHSSPQGQNAAGLIMDEDQKFQGLLGENLAAQPFDKQYGIDVDIYARSLVNTWLASPAHKANLAYASYDRSAVGATVGDDTIYVVQLFATDLGLPPPLQPASPVPHPAGAAHGGAR